MRFDILYLFMAHLEFANGIGLCPPGSLARLPEVAPPHVVERDSLRGNILYILYQAIKTCIILHYSFSSNTALCSLLSGNSLEENIIYRVRSRRKGKNTTWGAMKVSPQKSYDSPKQ